MLDFDRLDNTPADNNRVDYLMNEVEDMNIKGDYKKIDEYILEFVHRNSDYSFYLHVAFLTVTCRFMDDLKNHNLLFHSAVKSGLKVTENPIVMQTLMGLNRKDYKEWLSKQKS